MGQEAFVICLLPLLLTESSPLNASQQSCQETASRNDMMCLGPWIINMASLCSWPHINTSYGVHRAKQKEVTWVMSKGAITAVCNSLNGISDCVTAKAVRVTLSQSMSAQSYCMFLHVCVSFRHGYHDNYVDCIIVSLADLCLSCLVFSGFSVAVSYLITFGHVKLNAGSDWAIIFSAWSPHCDHTLFQCCRVKICS